MPNPHLIYFADPMCSWCWGFAPVISAINAHFGDDLPIRLVLGGLRPGTTTPLSDAHKQALREHWGHVHDASGQPIDYGFFDRENFVYDTEPASRAVVVLRRQGMGLALSALHRLQEAFYAENRDVTQTATLVKIAAELGADPARFAEEFAGDLARTDTQRDAAISQQTGVSGFPTLIVGTGDDDYALLTQGFERAEKILPALIRWRDAHRG